MIALGIFMMILVSIYSIWTAILRADQAARNAARSSAQATQASRPQVSSAAPEIRRKPRVTRNADLTLEEEEAEEEAEEINGWLALYEGDLRTARNSLRSGGSTADAVMAMALLSRTRVAEAPLVGRAFLAAGLAAFAALIALPMAAWLPAGVVVLGLLAAGQGVAFAAASGEAPPARWPRVPSSGCRPSVRISSPAFRPC